MGGLAKHQIVESPALGLVAKVCEKIQIDSNRRFANSRVCEEGSIWQAIVGHVSEYNFQHPPVVHSLGSNSNGVGWNGSIGSDVDILDEGDGKTP